MTLALLLALLITNALWIGAWLRMDAAARTEREGLLNRIQHPEVLPLPEIPNQKAYVGIDDDADHWKAQEEMLSGGS